MYIIRADGNTAIGMGHVMRCLSIADAMKERNIEPVFMTADAECESMIEDRGFKVHILGTDYRNMESELPLIRNYLETQNKGAKEIPAILVDSYQVTSRYYEELRKLAKAACLEDMGQSYPVDLLINYNIYGPKLIYDNKITCATLLGTRYQPLRSEFQQDIQYDIKDKMTDVMITTGGSDPYFAARAFADAFLSEKELQETQIRYHIISGPFNTHGEELHKLYDENPWVEIHEHVTCMKEIMKQCDVVLSATGSTIYEVSALGVPLIAFYFAENQRQGADMLSEITHVINCGNYAEDAEQTVRNAVKALLKCVKDKEYRETLYHEERSLVDGRGAARIAQALIDLTK